MRTSAKNDKIEEVLEFLDSATQKKKDEFFGFLVDKYEHMKDAFEGAFQNGEAIAEHAKKQTVSSLRQGERKLEEAITQPDKKSHGAPWALLGGLALGALVFGLLAGHKK
jgi:hypothetical protein